MTRKRYIKLMMSKGYSRNEANNAVRKIQAEGGSYADYAILTCISATQVEDVMRSVCEAVNALVPAVIKFAEAVAAAAAAAFVAAYKAVWNAGNPG